MGLPFNFDLLVYQYADFLLTPVWSTGTPPTPVSYAGATATLMARVNPSDASPIVSISTTPSTQGAIYLGATTDAFGAPVPAGGVEIWISKTQTALLTPGAVAGFDLMLAWANGETQTFATGRVFVRAGNAH